MTKKMILRILTVFWALCIAIGAIIRGYKLGALLQTLGFAHVATHFGVFAVLGVLIMLSFDSPNARLLGVCAGVALGIATELYEHMMFHGPMEYRDAIVDTLGVLAGVVALLLMRAILSSAKAGSAP